MAKTNIDYAIKKTSLPRSPLDFFHRMRVTIHRSGGVSRARLKYRVLLGNARRDGFRYSLIKVRVPVR